MIWEFVRFVLTGFDPIYPLVHREGFWIPGVYALLLSPMVWIWMGWWQKRMDRIGWRHLLIGCVAAMAFDIVLSTLAPHPYRSVIRNENANSFYHVAVNHSVWDYLRNFLSLRTSLSLHATSNMPGKVMFFEFFMAILDRPNFLAAMVLLISNLGGVFLFLLTERLTQRKSVAIVAAFLYWFHPAKIWFFPLLNSVTPAFLLLSLWLYLRAGDRPTFWRVGFSSLSIFWLFLFDPLPLVFGLVFLAFGRVQLIGEHVLGVGLIGFFFWRVTGFNSVSVFWELMSVNSRYYDLRKPVSLWWMKNFFDLSVGLGYATVGGILWGIMRGFGKSTLSFRRYAIATLSSILVLNFMGVTRGEEILRLWIFVGAMLFPLFAELFFRDEKLARKVVVGNLFQTIFAIYAIGFIYW